MKLWASLDKKYKTEDVGIKKFIVGRFLKYKMVDNKTVISEVQEFQLILYEIKAEGMLLSETFQVAISWRNSHLHGEFQELPKAQA